MHPLRRILVVRAFAAALLSLALWQHQSEPGSAETIEPPESWQVPLEQPIHLINPFFQPNSDYSAGHRGIDYRVMLGQRVLSPTDATVWFVGKVVDRSVLSLRTTSGELVAFEPVCTDLRPGERVTVGQTIARVCQPDGNYEQHCDQQLCLHFSLRTADGYLSPIVRIGGYSPTVLLPQWTKP
jgi:murein DD-endopeptidase MepM/ murein hydrolase activator NlpD